MYFVDFGLGQICRGCGDCTTCTACPASTLEPTTTPITSTTTAPTPNLASTPVPTWIDGVTSTTPGVTTYDNDCSKCENLTSAQEQALASYNNSGKKIVCDPTCLDNSSDPSHCNCKSVCLGCWTQIDANSLYIDDAHEQPIIFDIFFKL